MFELNNLNKTFKSNAGSIPAVVDVSLKIAKGDQL